MVLCASAGWRVMAMRFGQWVDTARCYEEAGHSPTWTHTKPPQGRKLSEISGHFASCRGSETDFITTSRSPVSSVTLLLRVQGSCPVQHLKRNFDWLLLILNRISREISYIYILHGNGPMYVIERRLIHCIIFFMTHYICEYRLINARTRIRLETSASTMRRTHGEMRRRLTSVGFIASFFYDCFCPIVYRFSLHELVSCAIAGVSTSGRNPGRLDSLYRNQYLYFLYLNIWSERWLIVHQHRVCADTRA